MPPWVVAEALVCALVGLGIGNRKGHPVWGFFLGLLLSVIGVIIISVSAKTEKAAVRQEAERIRVRELAEQKLAAERERQGP